MNAAVDDPAIAFADEMGKGAPVSSGDPAIDMAASGGAHSILDKPEGKLPSGAPLEPWQKSVLAHSSNDYEKTQLLKQWDAAKQPDSPAGVVARKLVGGAVGLGATAASGYRGMYDLAAHGLDKATQNIEGTQQKVASGFADNPNAVGAEALAQDAMNHPAMPTNWISGGFGLAGKGAKKGLLAAGAAPELAEGVNQGISQAGPLALGFGGRLLPSGAPESAVEPPVAAGGESAPMRSAPTVSDQILSDSRKAGYVVPPATTNPSILNRTVEGFGGKASVAQAASIKNQTVTNGLVRKALNLPEDAPLTMETLNDSRAEAGKTYGEVADSGTISIDKQYHSDVDQLTATTSKIKKDFPNYSNKAQVEIKELSDALRPTNDQMDASTAVELSKDLRHQANANDAMASRTADPNARALASAQRDAAEAIEDQVTRHLTALGKPDLATEWNAARTHIAKTYTVQKALDGAGNVDAIKLGRTLKNKNYSDELQTAADFANAFPKAARVAPGKESMPGMSPLDVYGSVAASLAAGNPAPMLLGPGRMVARSIALSKGFQPKGE